jgi:hypothetical protein
MKTALAGIAAVVLIGLGAWIWREQAQDGDAARRTATADASRSFSPRLGAGATGSAGVQRSALWTRPAGKDSPTLFGEFLRARDYRALYDRLNGTAEGNTSEGKLVLYEILKACTTVGHQFGWRGAVPPRETFTAAIAATDPQRERRMAAYEQFVVDKCAGLGDLTASAADLMKLLNDAAAMGDPKARAIAMEQQMLQQRRASKDGQVTLSDEQVRTLQSLAATKDPEAIRAVGRVLATGWTDYGLRFGNDPTPIEPRPFMNAWLVLSCEYGGACAADTPRMLQACAMQGYCDAEAYPDLLFHYIASPHDAQRIVQYRTVLRNALESGDWSQLVIVRGAEAAAHRTTFVPGMR